MGWARKPRVRKNGPKYWTLHGLIEGEAIPTYEVFDTWQQAMCTALAGHAWTATAEGPTLREAGLQLFRQKVATAFETRRVFTLSGDLLGALMTRRAD